MMRRVRSSHEPRLVAIAQECEQRFGAEFTIVSKCDRIAAERMRTTLVWHEGQVQPDFEYDVANSPCEDLLRCGGLSVARGVQARYPAFALFESLGIEGYVGMPLLDSAGRAYGGLVLASTRELELSEQQQTELELLAILASEFLDRRRVTESSNFKVMSLLSTSKFSIFDSLMVEMTHELNQPLTVIENLVYLIDSRLGNDVAVRPIRDFLREISGQIDRVGERIRELRRLSHQYRALPESVDLNQIVTWAGQLFESECWDQNIDLRFALDPELPPVTANKSCVEIALLYVLQQIMMAISGAGLGSGQLELSTRKNAADQAAICVALNGQIRFLRNIFSETGMAPTNSSMDVGGNVPQGPVGSALEQQSQKQRAQGQRAQEQKRRHSANSMQANLSEFNHNVYLNLVTNIGGNFWFEEQSDRLVTYLSFPIQRGGGTPSPRETPANVPAL